MQVVPSMCESVLQTYISFQHMFLALKEPKMEKIVDNMLSILKNGTNLGTINRKKWDL